MFGRAGVLAALAAAATAAGAHGSSVPPPGDWRPLWSHDGSAIAFYSLRDQPGMRVISPDGTGERLVAPIKPWEQWALSRDWFWLAHTDGAGRIWMLRPEGDSPRVIAYATAPGALTFRPDARELAFADPGGVFVVNTEGRDLRRLDLPGSAPSWSPSGDRVAYVGGPFDRSELRIATVTTGAIEVVDTVVDESGGTYGLGPRWSPDGRFIAYVGTTGGRRWVRVREVGGPVRLELAAREGIEVDWRPDSAAVAISGGGVRIVELASGRKRTVSRFGVNADWSPDGSRLAFSGGGECGDRLGIYVVAARGGAPHRLTNACRAAAGGVTALQITVWPEGKRGASHRWTLRCSPPGGTLPARADACRRLADMPKPFAPVPPETACTQVYGGPQTALVQGTFRGGRVWTYFRRRDGCEIARWQRVKFLFP